MSDEKLQTLRAELDKIDIEIQSLLNQRADISLEVKKVKQDGEVKLKPGREAQILRTLIDRHHGHFPKPELIRIWREMLSASLQAQGPFSIAVYLPEDDPEDARAYLATARAHFGAYTQMDGYASQRRVIEAVIEDECSIGILPIPQRQESDPWWRNLAVSNSVGSVTPRIIARLPFSHLTNENGTFKGEAIDSLVIGKSEFDPSGEDCTYISLDLSENIPNSRIDARLAENGMTGSVVTVWHDQQAPERWLSLIKVNGFISPDDQKLDRLAEGISEHLNQAMILGGYAVPISSDLLSYKK